MAKKSDDVSKEEQIGYHKGALSTLVKERQELQRLLQIVEQIMQMHIQALKELGIDLEAEAQKVASSPATGKKSKKKIDDLIS